MKLLISQKDQIFDIIEREDLSPFLFEFIEDQKNIVSRDESTTLSFKRSNFYFKFEYRKFDNVRSGHYFIYSPALSSIISEGFSLSWENQLAHFEKWLKYLKREIQSPNKWARLEREIDEVKIGFIGGEGKFSFKECAELKDKINILKSRIKGLDLSKDQVTEINSKLDLLVESAKTLSKFDWKSLFIGTIISITIQLSLTPENSKALWEVIRNVFHQLLLN